MTTGEQFWWIGGTETNRSFGAPGEPGDVPLDAVLFSLQEDFWAAAEEALSGMGLEVSPEEIWPKEEEVPGELA